MEPSETHLLQSDSIFHFLLLQVNEECAELKANLTEVESECQAAKSEVTTLNDKVRSLEEVIQVGQGHLFFQSVTGHGNVVVVYPQLARNKQHCEQLVHCHIFY